MEYLLKGIERLIKKQYNIRIRKEEVDLMTKTKKEGFMQGVLSLMFSQVIIKILGLVYSMYLINKEGFGDES